MAAGSLRRIVMKTMRLFIFLSLVAISACAVTQKKISVEQDFIPGWKLGYERLDIVGAALARKDEARQYAVHSVGDPILTANIIVKTWRFPWQGAEYEISESDYFTKAEQKGVAPVYYKGLSYIVYSEDGEFVMELEKTDSTEGDDQFLVRPENDGIVVDLLHSGKITHRTYDELPAQYGCSNNKLRSVAHGEEFSYCTFIADFLGIAAFRNKVTRENGIMKIMNKQIRGPRTEIHLNQNLEIIYMSSEGLEFQKCEVETALAER